MEKKKIKKEVVKRIGGKMKKKKKKDIRSKVIRNRGDTLLYNQLVMFKISMTRIEAIFDIIHTYYRPIFEGIFVNGVYYELTSDGRYFNIERYEYYEPRT